MQIKNTLTVMAAIAVLMSCNGGTKTPAAASDTTKTNTVMENHAPGSFGYDMNFLQQKDSGLIVLKSSDGASQVIISPRYQAKVFTSSAEGPTGKSFGWVNYKAFDGPEDAHMNAYGGEDRLWLGPEGGVFSLYFKPGAKMEFEHWKTPAPIDTEPWRLDASDAASVSMSKDMNLQNYAGTQLQLKAARQVSLIGADAIASELGVTLNPGIKSVAFKTVNSITNSGTQAWDEKTGAPCMWNLDMFMPSEGCTIVIPYKNEAAGKVATTDYFGEIAKDRIRYSGGLLFFKADGKSRGKLGIPPARVKDMAGSYDAIGNVLTIVKYDIDPSGKYLNQEWRTDRAPFSGDAMNAYNDGPLADGKQMGPFYEIESVSPAAFLKPGATLTHQHSVFHFTGDKAALSAISEKTLGVSVEAIEKVFGK
ncbi:DUF6786 family protein [Niabella drilacis]|uniref:Uncharacterized protein n=1 Tax=Niabella drilacis (strain DSM 25811 / CCM 8410 / CCUG 62505 / LMG 26954 / E90) TaxID=1285928 RepID=A0A1G6JM14_NIADE|nr:DUF6786 family protein [Niabella drilacis]SDC19485.1 hypothetical protein SAMN04487894_101570 [Niabella drilacis]